MRIQFVEKINNEAYKDNIWEILCECDNEFFPSLSSREFLYGDKLDNIKPNKYFETMINELFIFVIDETTNRVVGFMSFDYDHSSPELQGYMPCNYLTTLCVTKEFRRQGLAEKLYDYFENNIPSQFRLPYIATRTWSTNNSHIRLLEKIGFSLIKNIENHRGNGIHTFYFAKAITG